MALQEELRKMFEEAEVVSEADFPVNGEKPAYFSSMTGGMMVLIREDDTIRTQSLSTIDDYWKHAAQVGAENIRKFKFD